MSTLIIKNRNIGDTVLANPMVEALKKSIKKFDLLVRSGTEAFLMLCQQIDSACLILAKNDALLRYLWSHIRLIRNIIEDGDRYAKPA